MIERVLITPEAAAMVEKLRRKHGPLAFQQSYGCCDGTGPMCLPLVECRVGPQDVKLGEIAGCAYYVAASQFEYSAHLQLTLDVAPGFAAGFSLEGAEGVNFFTRSRLFTDDECAELAAAGPPPRGA